MAEIDYCKTLLEVHKELEDAISMKIKISHEQVLYIVTTDLYQKYKGAKERGNTEAAEHFEYVLSNYYFSKDEWEKVK